MAADVVDTYLELLNYNCNYAVLVDELTGSVTGIGVPEADGVGDAPPPPPEAFWTVA